MRQATAITRPRPRDLERPWASTVTSATGSARPTPSATSGQRAAADRVITRPRPRPLEEALGIYRDLGNRLGQANALSDLGVLRRVTGDYPAAAQVLEQALGIYRDLGNRDGEAGALNEKGTLHRVSGDLTSAEESHQQALELARAIASPWDEARALAGLGRCALAGERAARPRPYCGRRWRYSSGSARPRPRTCSPSWTPSPARHSLRKPPRWQAARSFDGQVPEVPMDVAPIAPRRTACRKAHGRGPRPWRRMLGLEAPLRARGDAVAEPPVTFAALLRELRSRARLTQEELAEATGLSPRSISDLERGIATTPRRDTIRLLADALGLAGRGRAQFEAVARGRPVPAVPVPAGRRRRRPCARCPATSPRSPGGSKNS